MIAILLGSSGKGNSLLSVKTPSSCNWRIISYAYAPYHLTYKPDTIIKHRKTQSIQLVELNRHLHQHFQAGSEHLTGLHLEIRFQHTKRLRPDRPLPCHQLPGLHILLHKLQITMSGRSIHPHIAHLRTHPATPGKPYDNAPPYAGIQL